MPTSRDNPGRTTEAGFSWTAHRPVYVAVFALTALAVYGWGQATADRNDAPATCSATAAIRQADAAIPTDAAAIQQRIGSVAGLRRAVRAVGLGAEAAPGAHSEQQIDEAVARARRDLKIAVERPDPAGELRISVTAADRHPWYAAVLANALAEQYAADCRTAWRRHAEQAYVEARAAADRAQREFVEAKARLEALVELHFNSRPPGAAPSAATPPTASPADDPEREVLGRRLVDMQRRRDQLLVDRTPLHPEVQDIEIRIAALAEQLAATGQQIPETRPPETPGVAAEPRQAEAPATFEKLKEAVDRAALASAQASRAEREAWEARLREPRIVVEAARAAPAPPIRSPAGLRLVLAAMASGMAVAIGFGMISTGAAMEPVLASVAAVRAALPVPVVGVLSEIGPARCQRRRSQGGQFAARWGMILAGLALLAGCAAMLAAVLG